LDASSAAAQYQNTGSSSVQTGNPQSITSSNLQPQTSSLQDVSKQSSDAIRLLDQGKGTIRVNSVLVTASTQATAATPSLISVKSTNYWVFAGLGLVIAVFIFVLYRGLMRQP
jgi:hypothetical protein